MKDYFKRSSWSPYIVGILLALLSWVTFIFMGKALGVSTTFVKIAGGLELLFAPEHVAANSYLAKNVIGTALVDWQFALVIFLVVGAFVARKLAGSAANSEIPTVWRDRFGSSGIKRNIAAFFGGALLMIGARLADGCTSGHAISGGLQLALSSWVFMISFFVFGIPLAFMIYKKR